MPVSGGDNLSIIKGSSIDNADLSYENSQHFIEDNSGNHYLIPDTVYSTDIKIDFASYRQTINSGLTAPGFMPKITALYANHFNDEESRIIIDFLYNYTTKIAAFSGINNLGNPVFSGIISDIASAQNNDIQNALIPVAKIVIRNEINNALKSVVPMYNIETMSGAWNIPHLLAALYFSIFYMQSDLEVFRKCGNPNCECFFLIKTTNLKRKYCDNLCRGAVNQQRFRLRKKQ